MTYKRVKKYMKEKLKISNANPSKEDIELYRNEIFKTEPMFHTELLRFIIDELKKSGFRWKTKEDLFNLLVLPNIKKGETYDTYYKSWQGWTNEKNSANIKIEFIRDSIAKELNLDNSIWDIPEKQQREIIPLKLRDLFNLEKDESTKETIDFSDINPFHDYDMTFEQKKLIETIKESYNYIVDSLLIRNSNFFLAKKENQTFLLKVLPILYQKGFYKFLNEKVFPSLSRRNRDRVEVKLKEINTLINLDDINFEDIFYLLDTLPKKSKKEKIDITTMIVSNFRKSKLKERNISLKDLYQILSLSIEYYNEIYNSENPKHYYPAINLVYMLKLFSICFPNDTKFKEYNLEEIYNSVQKSILEDKEVGEEAEFYATMSDLEFSLILNKEDSNKKIYTMLNTLKPEIFLAERPLFQMLWFTDIIEKFTKENFDYFDEAIVIIEEYIKDK